MPNIRVVNHKFEIT